MDILKILLIIVALGLIGAYAWVKIRERRESGEAGPAPRRSEPRRPESAAVVDTEPLADTDVEVEEVEEIDLFEDRPASSSWLEDIAVRDDDALSDLGIDDRGIDELDEAEVEDLVESTEIDELERTRVDEEFESITADLEVATDLETDTPVVVNEEVESADDIMANSRATEINPAGNTELQKLLQKVQSRLAEYE